jgi:hypothetical protein
LTKDETCRNSEVCLKEIIANEPLSDTLQDKRFDCELNHLIYAAATAITEEINGTGCYESNTQPQKHPSGLGKYKSI